MSRLKDRRACGHRPGQTGLRIEPVEPGSISHRMALQRHAQPGESTPGQILSRVARALGRTRRQAEDFESAMHQGLLPGGRILANAGARPGTLKDGGQTTLANCFVQPLGPGASGMRLALRQIGRTLTHGGGVGLDLSASAWPPRASGHRLRRALSILERLACRLERQGERPPALMGVLPIDHPAVRTLIHLKQTQGGPHSGRFHSGLRHFNLSVAINDDFMRVLDHDEPARSLWHELATAALDCGDPGVLFIDSIRRADNLGQVERLSACNPCGEQPLPPWGACVLASIDLTRLVRAPYTRAARIDGQALVRLTRTGVALLDEAIDHCAFPWPEQAALARRQRRVGLGLLGLGDALVMMGLRYDQPEGRSAATEIMRTIQCSAWEASAERARQLGPCPASDPPRLLLAGHSASRLPPELQTRIHRHGVRNSHLTCIAPTGTLSLAWADNASPGIEPIFGMLGERSQCDPQGHLTTLAVCSPALRLWQTHSQTPRPPAWITRDQTDPAAQISMVAALQPWVDAGISKTLALGPASTADEVAQSLRLAWRCGLKGLALYQERSDREDREDPGDARGRLAKCNCTPASLTTD